MALGEHEARISILEDGLKAVNKKLDQLIAAANMGRGAWWALVKVGGILVIFVGAAGWVVDTFFRRLWP